MYAMTRDHTLSNPILLSHALEQCGTEDTDDQQYYDDNVRMREYSRFLVATKGNEEEAQRRLEERVAFGHRQGNLIGGMPHPHFFMLKNVYHHGILGKTSDGSYVMVDQMGRFNQSMKVWRGHGVTEHDILNHSMLIMEWFCNHVDTRPYPGGRFVRVYDFEGFRVQHIRNLGAIRLGMKIIGMIEQHYPERLERCIVINAPPLLRHLWNTIVKNMLDSRTAEKFVLHKKEDTLQVMKDLLSPESLPPDYGGIGQWYGSAEERALFSFVKQSNESFGLINS